MSSVAGLSRESSETIGFVLTSLLCSAINREELRDWCYHVIGELDVGEPPAYLFDLAEYSGALAVVYTPLGFVPSWKHSEEDVDALYAIAMKRGASRFEWPINEKAAMAALASRPGIENRFRKTFPFISL